MCDSNAFFKILVRTRNRLWQISMMHMAGQLEEHSATAEDRMSRFAGCSCHHFSFPWMDLGNARQWQPLLCAGSSCFRLLIADITDYPNVDKKASK